MEFMQPYYRDLYFIYFTITSNQDELGLVILFDTKQRKI